MDTRDALHWSALVTALYALCWALGQLPALGILIPLAILLGVVAGTLMLVASKHVPADKRGMYYAGAVGVLIVHILFVLLLIGESSFTFGEDDPLAFNEQPPEFLGDIKNFLATYVGGLAMVLFTVSYWPLWASRDRGLAATGVGLNVLVIMLALVGVGGGQEESLMDSLIPILFALSFLPFAAAALLPLFARDAPGAWTGPEATPAGVATPAPQVSRRKPRKP